MEGFISTMETNALMGKNVARLIVDDMQSTGTGTPVKSRDGLAWQDKQSILFKPRW
jgi:prenylcysteine oxidase/farnesylcysteine lyase